MIMWQLQDILIVSTLCSIEFVCVVKLGWGDKTSSRTLTVSSKLPAV